MQQLVTNPAGLLTGQLLAACRAEGLVPRLEDRCSSLSLEKRRLQDKVAALAAEVEARKEELRVSAGQAEQRQALDPCN
jgi:outer membrane murein-binding lipoprotein Lpp